MSQPNVVWDQLKPYIRAFRTQYKLWVIPTLLMAGFAAAYASLTPPAWRASQAYQVRDELTGNGNQRHQGQFDSIDQMKVFQESIQQVARHNIVLSEVLKKVGPPPNHRETTWPTDKAVESLRQEIRVSAPKGSAFGQTDIFFVSITGPTPAAAVARTKILCDELERYLAQLRDAKVQSIVAELEHSRQLAQTDLDEATRQLEAMEREVGEDLGELRILNEIGSGDSNLRRALNDVSTELRAALTLRESLEELRKVLSTANDDTESFLATPGKLLESQPALKRLKEGLVDAQIQTARLHSRLLDAHPSYAAAKQTENEIRRKLHDEVAVALKGVQSDLAANQFHIERLTRQQANIQGRLDRLANLRARYSNLVSEVKRRTEIVDRVKKDLANAQSMQLAAKSTSQLTRFQDPVPEDRPVGPGRKTILGAGVGGGLALGAGLVFLFMPIGPNGTCRRWNDYVNLGRRATDKFFGRRREDQTDVAARRRDDQSEVAGRLAGPVSAETASTGRRASDGVVTSPPVNGTGNRERSERRQSTGRRLEDISPSSRE